MALALTRTLLLAAVVLALVSSAASAQAPTLRIELSDLPSEGQRLATNDTIYVEEFQVRLVISNMVCNREATVQVGLTGTATPKFPEGWAGNNSTVQFRFTPAPVVFSVGVGQYATAPYSRSQSVALAVEPSLIPPGGLEVGTKVTAKVSQAPSGPSAECAYSGQLPNGETSSPQFTYRFLRPNVDVPTTPAPEVPGPGTLFGLVALALGLVTARGLRPGGRSR